MKLMWPFLFTFLTAVLVGCASPYWTTKDVAPISADRNAVFSPKSATEEMLDHSPRTDCSEQVFGTTTMPICH